MRNTIKLIGLIAIVAVMGFGFVACDGNDGGKAEWGDWEVTTEPTLITEGEETRTHNEDASRTETRVKALPITTTALWEQALSQISEKSNAGAYTLTIGGDVGVAGGTTATFGTTATEKSLSVTLKGSGKLYLTSQGSLLFIGARQTIIIDSEGLTLQGLKSGQNEATQDNNRPVVYVDTGGTLELKKGAISDNCAYNFSGGGVNVVGTFTMSGGKISGNYASMSNGGGVYVFTGTFTMSGGEISGNRASASNATGGGVHVYTGTFTMSGGEIFGNTAWGSSSGQGAGVFVDGHSSASGTFIMEGGKIWGNTAIGGNSSSGGGVEVYYGTFYLVTGIIYGSDEEDEDLQNTASNGAALYLYNAVKAEYGTFSGTVWNKAVNGDLERTSNTIEVERGGRIR